MKQGKSVEAEANKAGEDNLAPSYRQKAAAASLVFADMLLLEVAEAT